MKLLRLLPLALLMLLSPSGMRADDDVSVQADDSISQQEIVDDEPILIAKDDGSTRISTPTEYADSLGFLSKAPEWARTYLTSLMRGNIDRTHEKRIDMGFAVTPSYTREAGFGIGGAATGLYRVNMKDSIQQPSNFFVALNASLNGFFVLTIKGDNLMTDYRSRLSYKVELYRKRLDFWGINSEETAHNEKSKYDRRQIDVQVEYIYKIDKNFYIGAEFRADYTDARNLANPEYLLEERPQYYVTGVGLSFEFDTRDNLLTPTKGIHIAYRPMLYPKFAGNAPASFHSHNIVINAYFGTWKGGLVAVDLYTKINSSKTPWSMREQIASDGIRMRGYYMGSYIDNSQIAGQVELRQHIWGRFGATVWGGCATLFSELEANARSKWLPNYGIGLRFEFKHNVNARIDYGFGRHTSGLVFAIGEAF